MWCGVFKEDVGAIEVPWSAMRPLMTTTVSIGHICDTFDFDVAVVRLGDVQCENVDVGGREGGGSARSVDQEGMFG